MPLERIFTLEDQRAFAQLSGDANPLHLDPVAARRTPFGATVVHGVHAALWILDAVCEARARPLALFSLRVVWRQPIRVGEPVRLTLAGGEGSIRASGEVDGRRVLALIATLASASAPARPTAELPAAAAALACRDLSFAEAAACEGALPLALDPEALAALLPAAARWLDPVQTAELLAATAVVGMVCPGLRSTFVELNLHAAAEAGPLALRYRVARAEPRYAAIQLAVDGPTLAGVAKTLYRPPPQVQADLPALAPLVVPGEFAGQRALVVGGSRGLGEVTVKLLAAGGADVVLTYHQGEADARRVAAEIGSRAIAFDCTAPPADLGFLPTHLYYFATPPITVGDLHAFSGAAFTRYCRYYVDGFAHSARAAHAAAGGPLEVFYPSTVYLDEPRPGMAEYCAAKAAGETLARHLEAMLPRTRCHCPRLPRLRTDQTLGFLGERAPEPQQVILSALRRMLRPDV